MLLVCIALSLCGLGCQGVGSMQAEMVEAAKNGNLKKFSEFFTIDAQNQYANVETMAKVAAYGSDLQKYELSHDHDIQWVSSGSQGHYKASGLALLLKTSGKVLWITTELECESSMSLSSSHPWPVDCKILKLNEPRELSIGFAEAKLVLFGMSCDWTHMKELLDDQPMLNPSQELFQGGPTALSAVTTRVLTDRGQPNLCHYQYRLLKWQMGQIK